jgi:hydrogenase nickel incorporation protein HypA/HybF
MHEQSIVESLLNLALEHAEKAEATRLAGINIVVGELSGVLDEAMEFYFGFLSRGTIAENAKLNFNHVPIKLRCRNCGNIFLPENMIFKCPECSEQQVDIVAGRELYIESIEVE